MDDLTSAIQRVIDDDQGELKWALGRVRDHKYRWIGENGESSESHTRRQVADDLRERVCGYPDQITIEDCTPMQFVGLAVSHMYTHADWRELADHYIQKVSEGC